MSKRKPIAAGNWKLNKNIAETKDFLQQVKANLPVEQKCEVIVAPTFVALAAAHEVIAASGIALAAQNCYWQNSGAFTGELSPAYLKDAGCSHVILGHSERRTLFHESDEDIRQKMTAAMAEGLIPIFCIGETLEEREAGQVETVLEKQVVQGLKDLKLSVDNIIIAYEPVWAIGTGKVASSDDAQKAHKFIRDLLTKLYDLPLAQGIRILYGGSAKPDNMAELIAQPDIDGGLIGGASLKADSFGQMINIINT